METDGNLDELLSLLSEDTKKENTGKLSEISIFENNTVTQEKTGEDGVQIHKGDTDSSDDEEARNHESKYNSYGKQVNELIKTDELNNYTRGFSHGSAFYTKNWKTKASTPKTLTPEVKSSTPQFGASYDPVFGIKIANPLVSSAVLKERMIGREAIPFNALSSFILTEKNKNVDWVVGGVVVFKSETRTSQKGSQYSILTVSDLKNDLKIISLFLFKNAYKNLWKTPVGTVIAVLNPNVLNRRKDSKDEATLSVDNPDRVMVLGQSKDLGFCKSVKKNGDTCNSFVNVSTCDFCIYHVKQEYNKFSKRSDIQGSVGNRGLIALRNKVLGKNEVFYAGKSFTAIKINNKKLVAKDTARMESLVGKQNFAKSRIMNPKTVNKLNAARVECPNRQRLKDLDRLKLLGASVDKMDFFTKENFDAIPSEKISADEARAQAKSLFEQYNKGKELMDISDVIFKDDLEAPSTSKESKSVGVKTTNLPSKTKKPSTPKANNRTLLKNTSKTKIDELESEFILEVLPDENIDPSKNITQSSKVDKKFKITTNSNEKRITSLSNDSSQKTIQQTQTSKIFPSSPTNTERAKQKSNFTPKASSDNKASLVDTSKLMKLDTVMKDNLETKESNLVRLKSNTVQNEKSKEMSRPLPKITSKMNIDESELTLEILPQKSDKRSTDLEDSFKTKIDNSKRSVKITADSESTISNNNAATFDTSELTDLDAIFKDDIEAPSTSKQMMLSQIRTNTSRYYLNKEEKKVTTPKTFCPAPSEIMAKLKTNIDKSKSAFTLEIVPDDTLNDLPEKQKLTHTSISKNTLQENPNNQKFDTPPKTVKKMSITDKSDSFSSSSRLSLMERKSKENVRLSMTKTPSEVIASLKENIETNVKTQPMHTQNKVVHSPVSNSNVKIQPMHTQNTVVHSPVSNSNARLMSKSRANALRYIAKNGPLEKEDPNNIKGSKSKKRILEKIETESPESKRAKMDEGILKKSRMKEIIEAKSINEHLITMCDQNAEEKHFQKLEVKERLEEKMMSTFKIACKAVKCLQCKYTSFSASELCKIERHPLKVLDATKRFYKCRSCSNRTVTLDLLPMRECTKCGASSWERTTMMQQRKVQVGENLSICGGDEMFLGSNVVNGNVNLLVPE